MKKTIIAASVLLGMSAGTASAQTNMRGSDTLYNVTRTLVATLGLADDINYVGGGSSNGENDIVANVAELGPMSRFLGGSVCAANPGAGCWAIGKDLLSIWANDAQACDALMWTDPALATPNTLTVTEQNNVAGLQCEGCVGDQFTFGDWRTVLRIIYAGMSANGSSAARDCDSDLRRTLVNSWTNLFKDGCATGSCAGGLRHAWRRDDASGTTESFRDNLQLASAASNPYCNGNDRADADPIRRACDNHGFNGTGDEVCRYTPDALGVGGVKGTNVDDGVLELAQDWSLGLVIPVRIPTADPYAAGTGAPATLNCGNNSFGGAEFGFLSWGFQESSLYGSLCPNRLTPVGGNCAVPKRPLTPAGTGFGCIASRADRPTGSNSAVDGRVYNLISRNNDGSIKTVGSNRFNVSYFRVHQKDCMWADATDQIGCFADDDACSIGFAGQGASLVSPDIDGLALRSKTVIDHDENPATAPIFVNVEPLEENFDNYGIARLLYICTLNADHTNPAGWSFGPGQSAAYQLAQQDLAAELNSATPTAVRDAIASEGFIPFVDENGDAIPLTHQECL